MFSGEEEMTAFELLFTESSKPPQSSLRCSHSADTTRVITDARYFITSDQTEYLIVVNLTGKYMIL